MLARITVTGQLLGVGIKVLFGVADAFRERCRCGPVQDAHPGTGAFGDLDAVKTRVLVKSTRTDSPDLAGRQRVGPDAVLALQFRRDHELLYAVLAQGVAEVGVQIGRASGRERV